MNTANFISNGPIATNIVTNTDGTITITTSQSTTYDLLFLIPGAVVVVGIVAILWIIFSRKSGSDSN